MLPAKVPIYMRVMRQGKQLRQKKLENKLHKDKVSIKGISKCSYESPNKTRHQFEISKGALVTRQHVGVLQRVRFHGSHEPVAV